MPETTPVKSRRFAAIFEFPSMIRPHRKNVSNDSANTCGCALKRLDRARVIMALDFERDCPTVANVDHSRIFFARFDQNIRAGRGKLLQFLPRIFVRAMFAPHHGKNTELREVRLAPEDFLDPLEFFRRKAVLFDQFGCNSWIGMRSFPRHWRSMLLNSRRPLKSPKSEILRIT